MGGPGGSEACRGGIHCVFEMLFGIAMNFVVVSGFKISMKKRMNYKRIH